MKKTLLSAVALLTSLLAFTQIDDKNNSVQAVTYWNKGDKATYEVEQAKYKVKGTDTTTVYQFSYKVGVTVLDSAADGYTFEWAYIQTDTTQANLSSFMKRLLSMSNGLRVVVKTTETGIFKEVENWTEVRDFMAKSMSSLYEIVKAFQPLTEAIQKMEASYSSKTAIESVALKDVQQFLLFNGVAYEAGEAVTATVKVPNIWGEEQLDAELSASLVQIDTVERTYLLRMRQVVNPEQLTDALFQYLTKVAKPMGIPLPEKSELKGMSHVVGTASLIDESGWVIYSAQNTVVSDGENRADIEEMVISLLQE